MTEFDVRGDISPADSFDTTNTIHVIDFKFGSGVKVLALSPDGVS